MSAIREMEHGRELDGYSPQAAGVNRWARPREKRGRARLWATNTWRRASRRWLRALATKLQNEGAGRW